MLIFGRRCSTPLKIALIYITWVLFFFFFFFFSFQESKIQNMLNECFGNGIFQVPVFIVNTGTFLVYQYSRPENVILKFCRKCQCKAGSFQQSRNSTEKKKRQNWPFLVR